MGISIKKVKFDGAKVRIGYERERDDGQIDEFTMSSADQPAQSFIDALAALSEDVIDICELPADQQDKLKVRGVTVTHTNDVMGVCITALKSLKTADAPLVLNTPHLTEAPYSEGSTSPLLSTETCDRISELLLAAERYLDGERAQGDLFTGVEPKLDIDAVDPVAEAHP
jgi:hypothetical protein